jgi:hypothetical protein
MMEEEFEKYKDDYIALVELVQFTTWVESIFEKKGAKGNGIWEKYDQVSHLFSKDLEKQIIKIAQVRNSAVHGFPKKTEIFAIKNECEDLEKFFGERSYFNKNFKKIDNLKFARLLYCFNKIEYLLRNKGGTGESFSDVVKSFNLDYDEILKCINYTKSIGHKYYLNESYTYTLKDQYVGLKSKKAQQKELDKYISCKSEIDYYYSNSERLFDGLYPTVKDIAHHRNQLLHNYKFQIKDFYSLEKACIICIEYFEDNKQPNYIPKVEYTDTSFYDSGFGIIYNRYVISFIIFVMIFAYFKEINSNEKKVSRCTNYYVTANTLSIREDSSKNSNRIGFVHKNDEVCISKEENNWGYIDEKGWVSKKYLTQNKPNN